MLNYNSRSNVCVSNLLPPSWSVTGSGLWLACPGSLSEGPRPGCDWHPALCTVLYVWPAQLKWTKLGLFLQAWSRPPEPPKSPQALNRQKFCTYFLFVSNREVLRLKSVFYFTGVGVILANWGHNLVKSVIFGGRFYLRSWLNLLLCKQIY